MRSPRDIRRKLQRVSKMSGGEVRARAASLVRRKLGWLARADGHDDAWLDRTFGDPASRAARLTSLVRALGARVYGEAWTPARLAEGLTAAGAAGRLVAEAEALRAHRFPVLGYGVRDAGRTIDWHRDLVSDARWPRRYWGLMMRGQAQGWDPKVVWEPNRHQHFLVLGAASALTGDRAYADEVADQLAGWIAQNPPAIGIHWVESIEPALRVLTWLWTLPLVVDAPHFSPDLVVAVLRSLLAQGRHVAANLSTYTAPNTHLVAEALALFVLGTVLPELEPARAWQAQGRAILEREIVVQVGADGVYREASLYYHAYAVELYVLAMIVAERNGVSLAPVVCARLERMFEALAWLARPDGSLPNVGDADGGRSLRLGERNLLRVGELLASGAALFGRADLHAGLAATGEEAAWLWPDGLGRVCRLPAVASARGVHHLDDARLVVERRRVDGDERYVLFDAGDLGMLAGGHGHAGCLGFELWAGGVPLIVDRGTYVYNAAPAWRRHFRGTRAHSTVVLDGRDQAEPGSEFQWTTRYRSRIVRHAATPRYAIVTGEHDGYRRLPDPVRHRRTLLSVAGEYWVCVDVLEGASAHEAEFLFQLAPELDVDLTDDSAFAAAPGAAEGLLVVAAGFPSGATSVVRGATEPIRGWHSTDYGEKRSAPTLVTCERLTTPAVRAHVLLPVARAARASVTVKSHRVDDGLVLAIQGPGFTDLLFCAPDASRRFAEGVVEFVGALLHARIGAHGALRHFLAAQATVLRWDGRAYLESDDPIDREAAVEPDTHRALGDRLAETR